MPAPELKPATSVLKLAAILTTAELMLVKLSWATEFSMEAIVELVCRQPATQPRGRSLANGRALLVSVAIEANHALEVDVEARDNLGQVEPIQRRVEEIFDVADFPGHVE